MYKIYKPLTLSILFFLFTGLIQGQPREIIFIIDTLESIDASFEKRFTIHLFDLKYKDSPLGEKYLDSINERDEESLRDTYPNFVSKLSLKSDRFFIEIPMDTSFSALQITGLYSFPSDTIKINKLSQLNTCEDEIIALKKWYYHMEGDSIKKEPHKIKAKRRVISKKCKNVSEKRQSLNINGVEVNYELTRSKTPFCVSLTSGHGYKPLKRYLRKMNGKKRLWGKVSYFYFRKSTNVYYYTSKLNLEDLK